MKLIGSIIVAKNSQKTIVIGKKGEKIKSISTTARKDNSKILDGLGIKKRI